MTSSVSPTSPASTASTPAAPASSGKPTPEAILLVLESQATKEALNDISKLTGNLAEEGKRMKQLLAAIQKDPGNKALQNEIRVWFKNIKQLVISDPGSIALNPLIDFAQFSKNLQTIANELKAVDFR